MSNTVSNQSKYWILELLQMDLIKLGFNAVLSGDIATLGLEPLLKVDQFLIYCDTRDKFTLYQSNFERLLSRVCKTKIEKLLLTQLAATRTEVKPWTYPSLRQ